MDLSKTLLNPSANLTITNLQQILHESLSEGDSGEFYSEGIFFNVKNFKNTIKNNIHINNPKLEPEFLEIL